MDNLTFDSWAEKNVENHFRQKKNYEHSKMR